MNPVAAEEFQTTEPVARTPFGPVAPYYDELMRAVPYRMWVSYYLLLLSQQDAHPKKILDVCCGTGRMCEMLVSEGFEMQGLDISAAMIDEARRKAADFGLDIRYYCMDASAFQINDTFDAAYSFFDSLNNITEPEKLQSAFERVAAHVRSGGSWIFDLNTAYAFEHKMFDQQHLRSSAKLKYKWVGDYDPKTRLISVRMQFWKDGKEFEEVHVQRAYCPNEVFAMLEKAGFAQIRAYDSYTIDPPKNSSDRIHYTAIRR